MPYSPSAVILVFWGTPRTEPVEGSSQPSPVFRGYWKQPLPGEGNRNFLGTHLVPDSGDGIYQHTNLGTPGTLRQAATALSWRTPEN